MSSNFCDFITKPELQSNQKVNKKIKFKLIVKIFPKRLQVVAGKVNSVQEVAPNTLWFTS